MSERSEISFGGTRIPYTVARSQRRKTVTIAVDPLGQVQLVAPEHTPADRLERIVHQKARWIVERRRRQQDLLPRPAPRELVSGETYLYLGRQYRLRVRAGEPAPVRLERGWLVAQVSADLDAGARAAAVREQLVRWYRAHAARRLPGRVEAFAPRLGVAPADVLLREQQKRWGSCDSRGVLRLNWRIIQAPPRLQDYVIVHELAHLGERDHSPRFWAAVGQVLPDYEARREALRKLGSRLVW